MLLGECAAELFSAVGIMAANLDPFQYQRSWLINGGNNLRHAHGLSFCQEF